MPLQRRAAQGFAGAAVEIDLIHKGIMTQILHTGDYGTRTRVEIDLIHKGIMTTGMMMFFCEVDLSVEIDLIHKGIMTPCQPIRRIPAKSLPG